MDDISFLAIVIVIVFAVLQIILFFKVWGMTNNVREVKDAILTMQGKSYTSCIMKGDKDKAYAILVSRLYEELAYALVCSSPKSYLKKASQIIEEYCPLAKEAGRELPEYLSTPEKFKESYEKLPNW